MLSHHLRPIAALVVTTITLAACKKAETPKVDSAAMAPAPAPTPAPSVSTIETGKHIGTNKRVTDTTSTFAAKDTLYLSVVSSNTSPTAMLLAKWTFQTGQVVDSTSQAVAAPDAGAPTSVTEFHLTKPSGWPIGTYTVEVFLDGKSMGSRQVVVKKK